MIEIPSYTSHEAACGGSRSLCFNVLVEDICALYETLGPKLHHIFTLLSLQRPVSQRRVSALTSCRRLPSRVLAVASPAEFSPATSPGRHVLRATDFRSITNRYKGCRKKISKNQRSEDPKDDGQNMEICATWSGRNLKHNMCPST
ncbi:hypothetical protein R6Q59_020182 [Mikania micrantha]